MKIILTIMFFMLISNAQADVVRVNDLLLTETVTKEAVVKHDYVSLKRDLQRFESEKVLIQKKIDAIKSEMDQYWKTSNGKVTPK